MNKWASWCGPCRAELPIFQKASTERGRETAFVHQGGYCTEARLVADIEAHLGR